MTLLRQFRQALTASPIVLLSRLAPALSRDGSADPGACDRHRTRSGATLAINGRLVELPLQRLPRDSLAPGLVGPTPSLCHLMMEPRGTDSRAC